MGGAKSGHYCAWPEYSAMCHVDVAHGYTRIRSSSKLMRTTSDIGIGHWALDTR